jgi:hypothetical protein
LYQHVTGQDNSFKYIGYFVTYESEDITEKVLNYNRAMGVTTMCSKTICFTSVEEFQFTRLLQNPCRLMAVKLELYANEMKAESHQQNEIHGNSRLHSFRL